MDHMLRICFFVVALAAVSLAAQQPCGSSSCSSRRRCHCQSEIAQLQQKIEGLEAKVNQLTAASTTKVAFTAKLSADSNYEYLDTMVFDAVFTNVGGAYNAGTGIFSAPKAGYYFFALNILSDTDARVTASLRKNNIEKCSAHARASRYETGTCEISLHLNTGDTVKVIAEPNISGLRYHTRHKFFSGFLIA